MGRDPSVVLSDDELEQSVLAERNELARAKGLIERAEAAEAESVPEPPEPPPAEAPEPPA